MQRLGRITVNKLRDQRIEILNVLITAGRDELSEDVPDFFFIGEAGLILEHLPRLKCCPGLGCGFAYDMGEEIEDLQSRFDGH